MDLKKLNDEYLKLKGKLDNINNRIKKANEEIETIESNKKTKEGDIKILEGELEQAKRSKDEALVKSKSEEIKKVELEIKGFNEKVEDIREDIKSYQDKLKGIQEQINDKLKELQENPELKKHIEEVMEKRYERRLKDEKKKLEVASNKKAKIEKLQEIVNKSPSVKNYLIGIMNSTLEIDKLKKQIDDLKKANPIDTKKIADLTTQISQLEVKITKNKDLLMGIRGLSKIDTPPKNRLPVQTYVVEKNNTLIKQVIERELARDGQVFYLYNRTDQIANVAYKISSTVPNAKVAIGHGQMDKNELEDVMLRFMNKEFNVLICTTIIETGIDIPNANTMIVEDADKFGLAQLYQIRGRVGRSERGAYAYLLYKKDKSIQDDALKRLKAIKEFTELGSGYKIAMRDLSIRGSGDILGGKQAGFIDDIGFEMYMKILQDAINVRMHKDEKPEEEVKNLNVSVDGYIPDDYVESDYEKLELYQRLDKAKTMSELNSLKAEFDDYYGNLPEAILTLIEKRKLEILSHYSIIEDIKDSGKQLEIIFSPNAFETISGDKLFLLANQLFTKPAFKSLDNKITIKINKHDQWLNRLNEFIETLSKK